MKKKILVLTLLALAAISFEPTLAFFSDTLEVESNTVTIGSLINEEAIATESVIEDTNSTEGEVAAPQEGQVVEDVVTENNNVEENGSEIDIQNIEEPKIENTESEEETNIDTDNNETLVNSNNTLE